MATTAQLPSRLRRDLLGRRHSSCCSRARRRPLVGQPSPQRARELARHETDLKGKGCRKLRFTAQGHTVGEAALTFQRDLSDAVESVREARSATSVQIGTHPSFAVRWLLPRLPKVAAAHPEIEVSVIVDRVFEELASTDLDLAIRMGLARPEGKRWRRLMRDELYPVMSPPLWESSGRPSQPADLRRLRLLHDRDPQASWPTWKAAHGPADLDVRKGPRFTSTDLVMQAAASGQGVALARHQLIAGDLASGALIRPLGPLAVEFEDSYWILLPTQTFPTAVASTVIEWLAHEAGSDPAG